MEDESPNNIIVPPNHRQLVPYHLPEYPVFGFAAILAGLVLVVGLLRFFLSKYLIISYITLATVIGILLGPEVGNVWDPRAWKGFFEIAFQITEAVLVVQLIASGFSLPRYFILKRESWWALFTLLVPILVCSWGISTGIIYAFFGHRLGAAGSIIVGAAVTPTDPVIASGVVSGSFPEHYIERYIRNLIDGESGFNDGAAFPFVALGIIILQENYDVGAICQQWFLGVWGYQVIFASIVAIFFGFIASATQTWSLKRGYMDRITFLALPFSLSFLIYGVINLIGGNTILAAFVCAIAYSYIESEQNQMEQAEAIEALNFVTSTGWFIFFGAFLPWNSWRQIGYAKLVGAALLILFLKRIPPLVLFKKGVVGIHRWTDTLFLGWFGPVGVSAVLYGLQMHQAVGQHVHFDIITFIVFISVFLHGLTASPFSQLLKYVNDKMTLKDPNKRTHWPAGAGFREQKGEDAEIMRNHI